MGGIAIVGATIIGYLVAHIRRSSIKFATPGWALLALITGLGVVGFIDDYLGVRAGRNLGLRKRGKTFGIVVVAAAFAWLAVHFVHTDTHLSFTQPLDADLGKLGLFLWVVLVVYATANAVNLTDGLDGLAAGSSALTFAAFMIIAFTEFRHPTLYGLQLGAGTAQAQDLAIVAAAMFGACAGFLWWNAAPARIIMGDTGSLAIGGAMAGLALLTRTALLLPILAGLPVVETLSVLAQVIAYRGFRRRVLRMAPIHHHFEVGGWSEFTVTVRFWLFAGICVAFAIGIFYADFLHILGNGVE
jgi:phospho-N-acetylmuramoyl-pentapeptide-transferase